MNSSEQPSLRERMNTSIAETAADISCNGKLADHLNTPGALIEEREGIMRTLTNPIQISNVVDTARQMPIDLAKGISEATFGIFEMPNNLVKPISQLDIMGVLRAIIKPQLAPAKRIGSTFTSNVALNSEK